jgi:hypothetical protein
MTVYVDDMRAPFGRMVMCHMLADSDEELHAMAEKIGLSRRWHQKPGTPHSHYDISLSKRVLAVANGAKQLGWRDIAMLIRRKREALSIPSITQQLTQEKA